MNKYFRLFAYFLLALLLSCQKDENITNNYYTDDGVDHDPSVKPKLVHSNPMAESIVPEIDSEIYMESSSTNMFLTFNKVMNLSSFNRKSISIKGPNGNISFYVYNYNSIGNNINLQLQSKLFANSSYEVLLDTSIQDIHGNRLDKQYKINFSTNAKFKILKFYISTLDDNIPVYGKKFMSFFCNSKIDSSIYNYITFSPQIDGVFYFYDYEPTKIFFEAPDKLLFDTEYDIKVQNLATDSFGNKIEKEYDFSFKTPSFNVKYSYAMGDNIYEMKFLTYNQVVFTTNGRIDTTDIRNNFEITPNLSFKLTKSITDHGDQISVFLIKEQQTPNTEYTFRFKKGIREESGATLKEDFIKTLKTGVKK